LIGVCNRPIVEVGSGIELARGRRNWLPTDVGCGSVGITPGNFPGGALQESKTKPRVRAVNASFQAKEFNNFRG